MERVQFQQEQMLQELNDLVDKKLFTQKEVKHIMKKRTAFETTLVRRVAKKSDYLRYITYEMGLEQLRRKRVDRMKLPPAHPTVSDYALVRRQFHVFERALRKFKSDVGLWTQYIHVAKREGARALVGRITARALQLHPNTPALYILAASHELDSLSPSAARSLLQRGIRLNPESVDIWREYVRMELGFIESLRRRWDVLGIDEKGKKKAVDDDPSERIMGHSGEAQDISMEDDLDAYEGDEGRAARLQIMDGGIVKSVISSAALAIPKIALFESLKDLISSYPSPKKLCQSLLAHLYEVLNNTLPKHPQAILLLASRFLESQGEEFVEGLRLANEELLTRIKDNDQEAFLEVYANFIEGWFLKLVDDDLKTYLMASLTGLIQRTRPSPSLLSVHIKLLMLSSSGSPAKVLRMAGKYTRQVPTSPRVWLARLAVEKQLSGEPTEKCWAEARRSIVGTDEERIEIWTWGLLTAESPLAKKKLHERLLKESMQDVSLRGVHEALLVRYVGVLHEVGVEPNSGLMSDQEKGCVNWLHWIRHMAKTYLTTGRVWRQVFARVSEACEEGEKEKVLGEIYELWKKDEGVEATIEWGRWLLMHGKGREATEIVMKGMVWFDKESIEGQWREELSKLD